MSETIEEKCLSKGVKLTDQRKVIAQVYLNPKKPMGSQITLMQMDYTIGYLKLILKLVLQLFTEQ